MRVVAIAVAGLLLALSMPVAGQGSGSGTVSTNLCETWPDSQPAPGPMPVPPVKPFPKTGGTPSIGVWIPYKGGSWLIFSTCTVLYEIIQCVLALPQCLPEFSDFVDWSRLEIDYGTNVTIVMRGGAATSAPVVDTVPIGEYLDWYDGAFG